MFHSLITMILYDALKKAYENGQITKVEVALREREGWFRAIFNQTFGFIGLMESIGILVEGNQAALKFGGITSSKLIRCPLSRACWSDFSRDMEDLSSNLSPQRGYDVHTEKSGSMVDNPKKIQAQLGRVIRRASTS